MLNKEQQNLVAENTGLAYAMAKKFNYASREELESDCLYWLCRAAIKFDPSRNLRFSTFAYKVIWNGVNRHYLTTMKRLVRCPRDSNVKQLANEQKIVDNRRSDNLTSRLDEILIILLSNKILDSREALILRQYYYHQETFQDISAGLGITKQRTKQIYDKALVKIKNNFSLIEDYYG